MKSTICVGMLLFAIKARSQTFVNYTLTNLFGGNGGVFGSTNTILVSSNQLVRVLGQQGSINVMIAGVWVQYPADPSPVPVGNIGNFTGGLPQILLLGPCYMQLVSTGTSNSLTHFLVEFDNVTGGSPQNTAVQPAGHGATITLQSSTDLMNWSTATNGTYSTSSSNRFFRMNFSVQ